MKIAHAVVLRRKNGLGVFLRQHIMACLDIRGQFILSQSRDRSHRYFRLRLLSFEYIQTADRVLIVIKNGSS